MQIIFSTPDEPYEREIMSRLCDDLAKRSAPLYKQAHLLLRGAMGLPTAKQAVAQLKREGKIILAINPNAGIKPAYPHGRFASKEKGWV